MELIFKKLDNFTYVCEIWIHSSNQVHVWKGYKNRVVLGQIYEVSNTLAKVFHLRNSFGLKTNTISKMLFNLHEVSQSTTAAQILSVYKSLFKYEKLICVAFFITYFHVLVQHLSTVLNGGRILDFE